MKNGPYPYYEIADVRTLRDLLSYGCDHGGDRTVFYTGKQNDQALSFRAACRQVEAMGTYLLSEGYRGCRIALLGENSTAWCLSYFAITNSGNTVVPLDRELPVEEIAELLLRCGCAALIYSDKHAALIKARGELGLDALRCYPLSSFSDYVQQGEALLERGATSFADVTVLPETLACIVYTSGTSGRSKGVMLSHGNLASDAAATCRCVTADSTQIFLPLNHSFSWASAMFAVFLYAVDAHISGSMKRIVKDLKRNKPQNISAVPLMVEMLYNGIWTTARKQGLDDRLRRTVRLSHALLSVGIDLRKRLFRSVREVFGGNLDMIICGGAALDRRFQEGLYDFGIKVINGYGITECSPVVAVNRNNDFRFGSVGKPLPCNRVTIHEPDGDGIGEIYVAGSNVMLGYYDDPAATAEAFDGEWFKTGDYGRMDEDGFLYITGRKKNLIILANGKNVSPEELEEKLAQWAYVKEVAVYEEQNAITAEFYLDPDAGPDERGMLEADIKDFNAAQPSYKAIARVKIRETPFEKTSTMKIKRYLLSAQHGEAVR